MIKQEYYDYTGKLKPAYAWQKAYYKVNHPELDVEARQYAALFVFHPSKDPYEAYIEKIQELINLQPAKQEQETEVIESIVLEVA